MEEASNATNAARWVTWLAIAKWINFLDGAAVERYEYRFYSSSFTIGDPKHGLSAKKKKKIRKLISIYKRYFSFE